MAFACVNLTKRRIRKAEDGIFDGNHCVKLVNHEIFIQWKFFEKKLWKSIKRFKVF